MANKLIEGCLQAQRNFFSGSEQMPRLKDVLRPIYPQENYEDKHVEDSKSKGACRSYYFFSLSLPSLPEQES